MRDGLRIRISLFAAATALSWIVAGCATLRPEVREARRDEAAAERPPAPPLPEPLAPSRAIDRPAAATVPVEAALRVPAAAPRPFATLSGGSPGRQIEAVDDLLFAPSSASLDARSRAILDALAARLEARGGAYRLEIQGHADGAGSAAANLRIGLRRAEAVARHLRAALGIGDDRIRVVSLGSMAPAAAETSAAARARNRRAVVLVLE